MRFPQYGLHPIPPRPGASREEVVAWKAKYQWWFDNEARIDRKERHAKKRRVIKLKRIWQAIYNNVVWFCSRWKESF